MAKLKRTYHRKHVKKDREITDVDRAFYKLGVMDGENRNKQSLIALQNANRCLAEEIVRLDREDPIVGVVVPFRFAGVIIKSLRVAKTQKAYQQSRKFKQMVDKAKVKAGIIPD